MPDTVAIDTRGTFPLEISTPEKLGLHAPALARLGQLIDRHIAEGRYPGAQIAVARHGKLALFRSFGQARIETPAAAAKDDTLWLLFSNTKVIASAGIWALAEEGALRFGDRVADHIPEFAANGKGDITIIELLSHRGGFPSQEVPPAGWSDHGLARKAVANFTLEWTPGSRLQYHGRSAHWVAAMLIEAVAKVDFRDYLRSRVIEPLGLGRELFVGLPESQHGRAADMHEPGPDGKQMPLADQNAAQFRLAGVPSSGGYATARAMAAFYQMLVNGGTLAGHRIFAPRTIEYVTRNFTGDMVDQYMGMPMHRGLGPHLRGTTDNIRGLGALAAPRTFGHGGVGSSYCWGDPDSGVSFAYISNSRVPDPWHSQRMDLVSNLVHTSIDRA
ncbi:MAG: class A beta-lactamase-related serine hydrolase [Alphaproteobacteria bacterium]|nr:class A beta-lactamase-related serine hydrolase [Alphaproteobacteria bacterium]